MGNKFPCVYAPDAEARQKKWCYCFGSSWVKSTADVVNGVVYIGSSTGYLYALDTPSGAELWMVETDKTWKTRGINWFDGHVVFSSALANNMVFFGELEGKLYSTSTGP